MGMEHNHLHGCTDDVSGIFLSQAASALWIAPFSKVEKRPTSFMLEFPLKHSNKWPLQHVRSQDNGGRLRGRCERSLLRSWRRAVWGTPIERGPKRFPNARARSSTQPPQRNC